MSDSTTTPTDAEIWDACAAVISRERSPLEVWRVASAARMPEAAIIEALLRETLVRRKAVTFRFPPLPSAAITAIGNVAAASRASVA